MLNKFFQSYGFTRNESRVVLFLVLTFLLGVTIQLYKSNTSSVKPYDYSASDSIFAFRSQDLASVGASNATGIEADTESVTPRSNEGSGVSPSLHSININSATKDELVSLPGIGEAMAERIILYREENGPFTTIEDLVNVKGIGKKKMERITPFCTVRR